MLRNPSAILKQKFQFLCINSFPAKRIPSTINLMKLILTEEITTEVKNSQTSEENRNFVKRT